MLTFRIESLMRGAMSEVRDWHPGQPRPGRRRFLVTRKAAKDLDQDFWNPLPGEPRSKMVKRRWELYALIGRWLDGSDIEPGTELKPLSPWWNGVWEFRTIYTRPGSRLLGMVPYRNVFIAFGLYRRDFLGRGRSEEWRKACNAVRAEWDRLFGPDAPLCFRGLEFDESEIGAFWDEGSF